jgi:serine/threonine protein kinase
MENDLWRQAEEIFHAALERPRESRPAFLDEACGENAELRRQVERLILTDEQAGSFLEKPVFAGAMAEEIHMIGKTLGHYQITSQIGKGGMGEVYQAKDQKLGRDVAIKILPKEFASDADRVARFQREAKALASVIKGDVRLDQLPANLHPRVREAITRCLQKDLKRRYSSITDARYEIEQALANQRFFSEEHIPIHCSLI